MSLKRLGVIQPVPNTPTLLADVNTQYFSSVIVTNVNPDQNALLTVYIKPSGATAESQYAYILYHFPLERSNSVETHRFAMNALDEIWVESTVGQISFVCEGIPQQIAAIKYSTGPTANLPTAPLVGDQYYNTDTNQLLLYKASGWKTVTTS